MSSHTAQISMSAIRPSAAARPANSGMTDYRIHEFDLFAEVDRYFEKSSLPVEKQPQLVIIMGAIAVGKTTFRKQHFSTGYVLVDAGDIFLSLSRAEDFDFPGPFEEMLDMIGRLVVSKAIDERRHIVTELIGTDLGPTKQFMEAMRAIGYSISAQVITCDVEEALRRNAARGDDDISCYYAEPYQRRWLLDAARAGLNTENDGA